MSTVYNPLAGIGRPAERVQLTCPGIVLSAYQNSFLQPVRDSRHKSIIFMKANSEKQTQPYVRPEVELFDINPAGVICTSGETTGQNPYDPIYF